MAQNGLPDKPESTPMSMPRVYVLALDKLALMDGHANRSAIVRKLIDREARTQLGADWKEIERATLETSAA